MLTLVVCATDAPMPLVETLTPLVDGVVKGVFGRLFIVVTGAAAPDIVAVAREAGAELVEARSEPAGLAAAAARARTQRLCLADAGVIADPNFFPALDRFLRRAGEASDAVAATRPRSALGALIARPLGRVSKDQIIILPKGDAEHGVWGRSFGRRLTLLEASAIRLRAL